jgi:hypothetical protein
VKHRFLLDIMVIYHAIEGVDQAHNPDSTSADLLDLIGSNCHTVVVDNVVAERYSKHLKKLFATPPLLYKTTELLIAIFNNSAKLFIEGAPAPEIPQGITVPKEDEYIVRAALISRPLVVTAEEELRKAINNQSTLGPRALTPAEALELAKET